jgi:hypothetical protein
LLSFSPDHTETLTPTHTTPLPHTETTTEDDHCLPLPSGSVRRYAIDDPAIQLPTEDVAASDSIRLGRLFLATLNNPRSTFTVQTLSTLRQWAKARNLYGTQFGYPGGCAWATMLWAYTQWLDFKSDEDEENNNQSTMTVAEIMRCFFVVISLWPWPLPFSYTNMAAVVRGTNLRGSALQGSVGRYLTTAFVVMQPCGRDGWNMTQSVQWPQQRTIAREAWAAATALSAIPSTMDERLPCPVWC